MTKSAAKRNIESDLPHGRELAAGYIASGIIFAGVTAVWSFVVRDDPFYQPTDLFGASVPVMLSFYLALLPFAGFLIGRWRYDRGRGGIAGFTAKLGARALHFTYAHSLIVLFTTAMLAENLFGVELDEQIKRIDDRMFDFAARFAPWLAAYLAGFNFGRATAVGASPAAISLQNADSAVFIESPPVETSAPETALENPLRAYPGVEPAIGESDRTRTTMTPRPRQTASGLTIVAASEPEEPGFLPPQDFDRLRPSLNRLR